MRQVSFRCIPRSQPILYLFCICIALAKDLTNVRYSKNAEKREEKVFKDCCVCKDPIDGILLSFQQLSCGHRFHTNCINQWFKDQPAHMDLICPMCRNVEHFEDTINTISTEDVGNNNYNNNNL